MWQDSWVNCSTEETQQHEHVYSCPECTQGFINKSDLNVHMKTHRLEKPHECNHCSMKFSLKDNLDLHLTQHDNSENCCSLCNETRAGSLAVRRGSWIIFLTSCLHSLLFVLITKLKSLPVFYLSFCLYVCLSVCLSF